MSMNLPNIRPADALPGLLGLPETQPVSHRLRRLPTCDGSMPCSPLIRDILVHNQLIQATSALFYLTLRAAQQADSLRHPLYSISSRQGFENCYRIAEHEREFSCRRELAIESRVVRQ